MPQRIDIPGQGVVEFPDGMSDDDIVTAIKKISAPQQEAPGVLASAAGALGSGVGRVALGAQDLVGQGLSAIGAERAGNWLQQDATQGRAKLEQEIAPYKEANPITTGVFETGGEILATLPVGGALAKGLSSIPGVAAAVPNLINAVRTSGMSAGGTTGATNALLRAAGGGIAGGASAALVDQDSAGTGALVGAALPGALQLAGKAGSVIGKTMRGPEQAPDLAAAVQSARSSGYVLPPTQARPTLGNRLLEGFSGKITTAQNASAKNQAVTNAKAARSLGLAEDVPLTTEILDGVRAEAGKAYKAVSELGSFDATKANLPASVRVAENNQPLMAGKTKAVDAGEVVRAWRQANADATAYYRAYARDANPETLTKAKAAASEATQIDDFLVKQVEAVQQKRPEQLIADLASGRVDQQEFLRQAVALGQQSNLAADLKAARVKIAKSYSVEGAMNPATGAVDARKLAKQLEKGRPLSGDLKEAAQFAGRFPKAAQTIEGMGSLPQTSPLDWGLAGGLSMATSNPLLLATALARPAARAATMSPMVQNRLIQPAAGTGGPLTNEALQQLIYRGAPALAADL